MRHTPLSPAEASFQGMPTFGQEQVDTKQWDQRTKPLGFTEGGRTFLVNESHEWVQRMRALSLPLRAGPSGHTQVFFDANTLLGAGCDPYDVRLAAIGHLLPIRAHSLVEILVVAARHSCDYSRDANMYKNLAPFTLAELRRIGHGVFPASATRRATARPSARCSRPRTTSARRSPAARSGTRSSMPPTSAGNRTQPGPVTAFHADATRRQAVEGALQSPLKTWNQRSSLATSDAYAADTEPQDRAAAIQRRAWSTSAGRLSP